MLSKKERFFSSLDLFWITRAGDKILLPQPFTFKLELKFDWLNQNWRRQNAATFAPRHQCQIQSRVGALAPKKILHFRERSFLKNAPSCEQSS